MSILPTTPASGIPKHMSLTLSKLLPRHRLEMLSDLVFGLSLSLGALSLITAPPSSSTSPAQINSRLIAFIFNFLIIVMIWIQYTGTMSILPFETSRTVFVNLVTLLLVLLEPYLLNIIQEALFENPTTTSLAIADYASILYAIDLGGVLVMLGIFAHLMSQEERGLVPAEKLRRYRTSRDAQFLLAAILLLSLLPQFWSTQLYGLQTRIYLWFIPLIGSLLIIVRLFETGTIDRKSAREAFSRGRA